MRRALLICVLVISGCGHEEWHHAKVISKTFVPSSTQVGYTGAGKGGVVVTSEPAKYVLVVEFDDGAVESVEVDGKGWARFHEGDQVEVDCRWWGTNAVKEPGK
jgi:hypothetical protein